MNCILRIGEGEATLNRPGQALRTQHIEAPRISRQLAHELTIQNYQRDALNINYSSNIITLLYMFRVSSTHLQEDIVVHKQHMVPSLSIRVLVSC